MTNLTRILQPALGIDGIALAIFLVLCKPHVLPHFALLAPRDKVVPVLVRHKMSA